MGGRPGSPGDRLRSGGWWLGGGAAGVWLVGNVWGFEVGREGGGEGDGVEAEGGKRLLTGFGLVVIFVGNVEGDGYSV